VIIKIKVILNNIMILKESNHENKSTFENKGDFRN